MSSYERFLASVRKFASGLKTAVLSIWPTEATGIIVTFVAVSRNMLRKWRYRCHALLESRFHLPSAWRAIASGCALQVCAPCRSGCPIRSPDFVEACRRQARAVAAGDPAGDEIMRFVASVYEWPEAGS